VGDARPDSVELPGGWLSARGVVGDERVLAVFRPAGVWVVLRTPWRLVLLVCAVVVSLVWWASGGGAWVVGLAVLLLALQVGWNALQLEARWYMVTERRVLAVGGVLGRFSTEMPLDAVRAVVIARPWLERMLGVGSVGFGSAATGGLEVLWVGVDGAEGVAERVRREMKGPESGSVEPVVQAARPATKAGVKKPVAKKKATAKKAVAKKTTTKKAVAKKTTTNKGATKKAPAKKSATKKSAKTSGTTKSASKKTTKKRGQTGGESGRGDG